MSSSSEADRVARIDATFADEDLRVEAYAVLARESGCSACVECCYPPIATSVPRPVEK